MSVHAYQLSQTTTEDPRRTEYRLFAMVTRALIEARQSGGKECVDALDWNRRLWLTLEMDLSSPRNRLPDALKAQLISLALWVDTHSSKVLRGEADLEPLVTVNRAVMEGLAGWREVNEGPAPPGSDRADQRTPRRFSTLSGGSVGSIRR